MQGIEVQDISAPKPSEIQYTHDLSKDIDWARRESIPPCLSVGAVKAGCRRDSTHKIDVAMHLFSIYITLMIADWTNHMGDSGISQSYQLTWRLINAHLIFNFAS